MLENCMESCWCSPCKDVEGKSFHGNLMFTSRAGPDFIFFPREYIYLYKVGALFDLCEATPPRPLALEG